ncbi:MAG: hypothetical protein ACYSW7_11320, partial [Planctomycetota bacterium]
MGSNHNTFLRGLETAQVGWHAAGTIDATATERDYDTAVALDNAVAYKVPPEINILEVRVILPVDGDDAVIDIWARRSGDANLVKVCKLTCKGGAVTYGTQSPGSTN